MIVAFAFDHFSFSFLFFSLLSNEKGCKSIFMVKNMVSFITLLGSVSNTTTATNLFAPFTPNINC